MVDLVEPSQLTNYEPQITNNEYSFTQRTATSHLSLLHSPRQQPLEQDVDNNK